MLSNGASVEMSDSYFRSVRSPELVNLSEVTPHLRTKTNDMIISRRQYLECGGELVLAIVEQAS